jgi:hypothetical protein
VDCLNLLAPNDSYRPPKVYHKQFDKNQKPVGLLDFKFLLARPQIHWSRSSDQWVFVKTGVILNINFGQVGTLVNLKVLLYNSLKLHVQILFLQMK